MVTSFFALVLASLLIFFPPTASFSIAFLRIPVLYLFFTLLFAFLFYLGTLILRSRIHGLFLGVFALSYLVLRLNGFTQLFFLILLLTLFVMLDLIFVARK